MPEKREDAKIPPVIFQRRSVRTYESKQVPIDLIEQLLDAGRWAPSAHNSQPWRFIILSDAKIQKTFIEAMARIHTTDLTADGYPPSEVARIVEHSKNELIGAPILILCCLDITDLDQYPDDRRQEFELILGAQSLAAAIQNILLAATSMGLGSCWHCAPLFCQEEVKKVFRLADNIKPQALLTIGYPSENPSSPSRKKDQIWSENK